MTEENRNQPPVPPASPSATPQDQTAASAQGGPTPTPSTPTPSTPTPPSPPTPASQGGWQQTHEKLQRQAGGGTPTWEQIKASGGYQIPPEYPADKFKPESFSIPAFLLSWIWYMVKGMWQKGLVILGAMVVVSRVDFLSFPLLIGIAVYAGIYGHRDYLRYHNNNKQQFWF